MGEKNVKKTNGSEKIKNLLRLNASRLQKITLQVWLFYVKLFVIAPEGMFKGDSWKEVAFDVDCVLKHFLVITFF